MKRRNASQKGNTNVLSGRVHHCGKLAILTHSCCRLFRSRLYGRFSCFGFSFCFSVNYIVMTKKAVKAIIDG